MLKFHRVIGLLNFMHHGVQLVKILLQHTKELFHKESIIHNRLYLGYIRLYLGPSKLHCSGSNMETMNRIVSVLVRIECSNG